MTTPVLFGSAVLNFGVRQLLDTLLELAPPPGPRPDVKGEPRPLDTPFSAFVFKIQAGMDTAHRDRLAYVRVCSGVFERGTVVTHAATGKPFATKYAQQVFGRDRETVDLAYPGDVVGLVNASALRVGDSLYVGEPVVFPPIPSFAPEHFAVCRAVDSSRYKQFRRGIEQLEQEGTVQVLRSDLRGDQAPVLAAVGPMQFEVAEHRMAGEFSAPVRLDRLEYTMARLTDREWGKVLDRESGVEVLERTSDGALLALFAGNWRLQRVLRDHPDAVLEPLVAASTLTGAVTAADGPSPSGGWAGPAACSPRARPGSAPAARRSAAPSLRLLASLALLGAAPSTSAPRAAPARDRRAAAAPAASAPAPHRRCEAPAPRRRLRRRASPASRRRAEPAAGCRRPPGRRSPRTSSPTRRAPADVAASLGGDRPARSAAARLQRPAGT